MSVLALQTRVIGALVLRETRATFGTTQIGYLWAIITPAASTAVLVILFSFINRQPPFGSSLALFFATGILTLELFKKLGNSLMSVFDANKALLTYPPIKSTDVIFARAILIGVTYVLIMVLFYSGLIAFGMAGFPAYPAEILMAIGATFMLGFGFGTTNAVMMTLWDSWKFVIAIVTRPLFFISGIFYVPSYMPTQLIELLKWNPVLHAVEWVRTGYYINYNSTVLDKPYLLGVSLVLIFIGLFGERLTRVRRGGA